MVGIYVNSEGKRSRKQELLWHSTPTNIGKVCTLEQVPLSLSLTVFNDPYLLVFCESNLEVYEVNTGAWEQTISIKKV